MGLENPLHIALLLVVVLMVFGAKRLPEMGRSLGSGLHGFKDALQTGNHAELSAATAQAAPSVTETEQVPVA
jgi:sec-independent protein translocase protein TatA